MFPEIQSYNSKMNIFVFLIILMSANGEDQSFNQNLNSTSSSSSNRHTRHKRYVAHINPIYRNFDFLKKDGEYFGRKCTVI